MALPRSNRLSNLLDLRGLFLSQIDPFGLSRTNPLVATDDVTRPPIDHDRLDGPEKAQGSP